MAESIPRSETELISVFQKCRIMFNATTAEISRRPPSGVSRQNNPLIWLGDGRKISQGLFGCKQDCRFCAKVSTATPHMVSDASRRPNAGGIFSECCRF